MPVSPPTKGTVSGIPYSLSPRANFFLFGDSITQAGSKTEPLGWVSLLADSYTGVYRCAEMRNMGLAGYNTRWAKLVLPQLIAEHGPISPSLCTVFFGANDSCCEGARQHVPLAEYRSNLKDIVAAMRLAWPGTRVMLITPPPIDKAAWDAFKEGDGERSITQAGTYASACKQVAEEEGCCCLDLFEKLSALQGWEGMMIDGLHFNAAGNAKVHELLTAEMNDSLQHLAPTSMPIHLPHHTDIDGKDFTRILLGE